MCGIVGYYKYKKNNVSIEILTNHLIKRGPDDQGVYEDDKVALGHTRLSILDLTTGHQPMFDQNKEVVVVFNGEIYNFLDIKHQLQSGGVSFATHSDTEVIIEAYKTYGITGCLERLEGMFAFALWDIKEQKLFIVRDRFGEKPLYYTQDEKGVYFASELKAIIPFIDKTKISKKALNLFFSLTYIPAPHTIYENVFKLEPGHFLEISISGVQEKRFYNLLEQFEEADKQKIQSYEEAQKQLRDLLFESVRLRMVSDVPLGAFLSGGIDSSIVSAIMSNVSDKPVNTFSIGFKEKAYDESERAKLVADHIQSNHHVYFVDHNDLLGIVDETLSYFDEPFGDSSAIPSMIVAKKAREKVTVVLTGDCADELFGGYEKYLAKYYADKYNAYPRIARKPFEAFVKLIPHTDATNHTLRKLKKVINSASLKPDERYKQLCSLGYNVEEKSKLLKPDFTEDVSQHITKYFNERNGDELSKTFYSDVKLVLEGDMLTKVDRACMLNSLEARVPFLDSKIVEFSAKLPHEFKILGTDKKKILKDTFADLLPEETLKFSKKGFGIPIRLWFQNKLKGELLELLSEDFLEKQGIFDMGYINTILNQHFSNKENHSSRLWQLFVFQKWYKNNIML